MKMEHIKNLIMDKICLYDADSLETLWTGDALEIPNEYLLSNVRTIGVKQRKVIDIGIEG